tara:strand:- start:24671 stop:25636 length:966 start_codon:yes stop_codon:yes gene_type:complete
MRKIAIFNQKGGVGKTTTAVNLGAGLSRNGKRVVIVDLDPQGDISTCHKVTAKKDLYDVLIEGSEPKEAVSNLGKNLDIIHADHKLADAEQSLVEQGNFIDIFERTFTPKLNYDYVLLDCPPSLRPINKAALFYSKEVVMPCSTDFLGHEALMKTINVIVKLNEEHSRNLVVSCVVPTMFDKRRKICKQTLAQMKKEFTPMLVAEPIRHNVKLSESPKQKKSIFTYAKNSTGAEDYWKLVKLMLENENMYDTKHSLEQREKAIREFYTQGKKRELMIVGNKITFGYKFFTKPNEIDKDHIINKIAPIDNIHGMLKEDVKTV